MARFTSSTFGKISGKHGTAVAAVRKDGLCILKEYRVASNPNTAGQKSQRGKFGFVMKEINCLRSVFTRNFGGQYGINKVVSMAMKVALTGNYPDFSLDFSKLPLSAGSLNNTLEVFVKRVDLQTLQFTWNPDSLINGSPNDKVCFVLLNSRTKFVLERYDRALRSDAKVQLQIPEGWNDSDIQAWIYFSSFDGKSNSPSQHITL